MTEARNIYIMELKKSITSLSNSNHSDEVQYFKGQCEGIILILLRMQFVDRNELLELTKCVDIDIPIIVNHENSFDALCELASAEGWCSKVPYCICANYHFRYGFLQLAEGKNPNHSDWMTTFYIDKNKVYTFPNEFLYETKQSILQICLESNVYNISKCCRFPNWLGYLGVVMSYLKPKYNENKDTFYELSRYWVKQLREIVPQSSNMYKILGQEGCELNLGILSGCERALNGEELKAKKKKKDDLVQKQLEQEKREHDYDMNIYQILLDTTNKVSYTNTARLDIYVKEKHIEMLDSTQYEKLCKVLDNVNETNSYMGKFKEKFLSGSL